MRATPYPRVTVPQRGQKVEGSRVRASIADGNLDEDVVGTGLAVLCKHIPIPPLVEDTCIVKFELRLVDAALTILLDQPGIGVLGLRVFIECLHVGVSGGGIQVVVVLFDIFTMVTLGAGQSKESLLEDRVFPVPETEREAEAALAVADTQETVLPPAVGTGTRVLVREVFPAGRSQENGYFIIA